MEDEELKIKYRNLQSKLYNIENKLEDLDDSYDELRRILKESLLIDDKIVKQQLFNSITRDTDSIYSEIVNGVIPRINNKL